MGYFARGAVCGRPSCLLSQDPRNAANRGGYGKFYAKWRINCKAPTYKVWVYKIIKTFQTVGGGIISYESSNTSDPNAKVWSEGWGNWGPNGTPAMFQCLNEVEYEYKYEAVIKWNTWLGIINDGKEAAGDEGEGTLGMSAQEYCGHSPS